MKTRRTKRGEVVRAYVLRRCTVEQRLVKERLAMQGVTVINGMALRTVPDAVNVPLAARVIARVKLLCRLTHVIHSDIVRQMKI